MEIGHKVNWLRALPAASSLCFCQHDAPCAASLLPPPGPPLAYALRCRRMGPVVPRLGMCPTPHIGMAQHGTRRRPLMVDACRRMVQAQSRLRVVRHIPRTCGMKRKRRNAKCQGKKGSS